MGFRGPQPKPSWLRVLDGNPGKRPIAELNEGVSTVKYVEPPEHLDQEERAVWDRVCNVLAGVKGLTRQDQFTLARYCEFMVVHRKASDFMKNRANGEIVYPIRDAKGKVTSIRMLPQLKAMLEVSNHLLRLEQHFGLTPASRVNFHKSDAPHNPDDDPFQ